MRRWKSTGLLLLLLLISLIGTPAWMTYRQARQDGLNRALVAAIHRRDVSAGLAALDAGADPNSLDVDSKPVSYWLSLGRLFTGLWEQDKPLPSLPGRSALLMAVISNFFDVAGRDQPRLNPLVQALIARGASVNVANKDGDTPLMFAAMGGPTDTVCTLLDKGAEVNARDILGHTALLWAMQYAQFDSAKVLLGRGADVNARDNNGWTALLFAAVYGSADMTKVLLNRGADVNARDANGQTALIYAAQVNATDTAKVLLAHGADVHIKGAHGKTALSYAKARGHTAVVHLLKQAGAKE